MSIVPRQSPASLAVALTVVWLSLASEGCASRGANGLVEVSSEDAATCDECDERDERDEPAESAEPVGSSDAGDNSMNSTPDRASSPPSNPVVAAPTPNPARDEDAGKGAADDPAHDASQPPAAAPPSMPPPPPATKLAPGTPEYSQCFLGFGLCAAVRGFVDCAQDAAEQGCLPMEVAVCAREADDCVERDPAATTRCNDDALGCLCDIPSVEASFAMLATLNAHVCP